MIRFGSVLVFSAFFLMSVGLPEYALAGHKDHEGLEKCHHQMWLGSGFSTYDLRYLNLMIHHHECNVAMSQDALQKAKHPELRAFAKQTIDQYTPEIQQMETWRHAWFNEGEPKNP